MRFAACASPFAEPRLLMRHKLAFVGIILLGSALLAAHLSITLLIGFVITYPQFEADMREHLHEALKETEEQAHDVGAAIGEKIKKQLLSKVGSDGDRNLTFSREAAEALPLGQGVKEFEIEHGPNVSTRTSRLPQEMEALLEAEPFEVKIKGHPITVTSTSRTYRFPGWLPWHGLIGTLVIICGTVLVLIGHQRRFTFPRPIDNK